MKNYTARELELFLQRNPEKAFPMVMELRRSLTVERMMSESYAGRAKLAFAVLKNYKDKLDMLRAGFNHEN